jgi:hypothetical protein
LAFSRALYLCWPVFQDEAVERETPDLSQAETEQKIKDYNGQINSNLFMSLVSWLFRNVGEQKPSSGPDVQRVRAKYSGVYPSSYLCRPGFTLPLDDST